MAQKRRACVEHSLAKSSCLVCRGHHYAENGPLKPDSTVVDSTVVESAVVDSAGVSRPNRRTGQTLACNRCGRRASCGSSSAGGKRARRLRPRGVGVFFWVSERLTVPAFIARSVMIAVHGQGVGMHCTPAADDRHKAACRRTRS